MTAVLAPDVLRRAADGEVVVVVGRVVDTRLHASGSRSEAAVFELDVEQWLTGSSPNPIAVWRYTSGPNALAGGRPRLAKGQTYVAAFEASPSGSPRAHALVDFALA
jgi:hypothetical protein